MTNFNELLLQAGLQNVSDAASFLDYSEAMIYRWKRGEDTPRHSVLELLKKEASQRAQTKAPGSFTFIDLFAGIGGLRSAFERNGGRCVFTSEWDRFSQQTYAANFRDNRPIAGDVREIDAADIPEHNVLVAGFPCQPFSIAGVSKKNSLGRSHGFEDETQGTLFFDVLRILKHHKPEAFLLENVKNLKSHDKGRTFEVIMRKLSEELGYQIHTMVIDAQHFVPQHRERIAIVGFKNSVPFDWSKLNLPPKGKIKMSSALHSEDGNEPAEEPYTCGPLSEVNAKYTLSDKLWQYLQNYAAKHKAKGNGFGFGLVGPDDVARTLSARYYKDGSEILVSRGEGNNPRRLTPRECARIMGYPESFKIPVSDTQAYKQFGNSVAVPVFAAVAEIMMPHVYSLMTESREHNIGRCA
ncbi:DNA (cytosine-5-)-methyltransferase [Pseudovibrio denitrificans]|uniref:DNA (cytosine-5-)-methyltransferase n=1 Tax=Pseudovibrio denitrificans TaxID=258256 RepID=UPI0039BED1AD